MRSVMTGSRRTIVKIWHRLDAAANDNAWSPGFILLADARRFQITVRALQGLWIYAGKEPPPIVVPKGLSIEDRDSYARWKRHRLFAICHAHNRTDIEWYKLARTAAHIAITWRLV